MLINNTQHAQCIYMQLYRAGKELEGRRREYESRVFLYGHAVVVYFSYVLNALFLSTHGYCHCRTVSCVCLLEGQGAMRKVIGKKFQKLKPKLISHIPSVCDQTECIATPFKHMQALDFDDVDDEDG
uniref:Uncharacterized protein n=1 Tax=Glossina austeni TaxID=7395 RepID=A0A1A9ULR8_GLOAU